MQRFKNILVVASPTAKAAAALQRAADLAAQQNARITVVDVLRDVPAAWLDEGLLSDEMRRGLLEEGRSSLLGLVEKHAVEADTKLLVGIPFIEIIREVLRGGYDLLVKPAEDPAYSLSSLGATDMHLLRKCPCPVWIVKPGRKRRYARVLAAVDPNPREPNAQLNGLILDLATSLAARDRAELHAVSAWNVHGERELRSRARQSDLKELLSDIHGTYKKWLKQLTSPYEENGAKFHVHLIKGQPEDVIPAEAKRRHIDVIVMGTVGRVGLPGFFIGNTAERTLSQVDCSVLAVKPEGFVSPVELER